VFRDVGNITMDINAVELVNVNDLGGADTTTVNDLTGTGVSKVQLDLAATPGTGAGEVNSTPSSSTPPAPTTPSELAARPAW
jgi:hypothetical protein